MLNTHLQQIETIQIIKELTTYIFMVESSTTQSKFLPMVESSHTQSKCQQGSFQRNSPHKVYRKKKLWKKRGKLSFR